ncbi:MAG: sensor histidine kinase [Pseudomonadota bacterium]|nr:sensor histidine kinase [Pseudomonadota bacterium]
MTARSTLHTELAKPKLRRSTARGKPWPSEAVAAASLWQAFDEAVALLQPGAAAPVVWCSPAWEGQLGLATAEVMALSLQDLCERLQGLAAGLAAMGVHLPGVSGVPASSSAAGGGEGWQGAVQLRQAGVQAGQAAQVEGKDEDGAADAGAVWLHAGLRCLPDGALALRLLPVPAHERATRRYLEDRERLLFTSRSVAVGEMATTLAHELNQPLGAVTNVLRGLKARLDAAIANPQPGVLPPLAQGVQLALDQVQYAARIIGRVRDYTQSRQPRRERVDLHALLHNSLALLDWDLGRHGVQLSLALAHGGAQDDASAVAGDGVMLQQVMVNLLRNAIDAMGSTPAGERRLAISSQVDEGAGQIEIAIADTGCGIDEGGAAQLFMPFYSTKPTGMGIGLNICRSLIELHQGRLWYTPNAGRGCTFRVALPLVRGEQARELPRFLDADSTLA